MEKKDVPERVKELATILLLNAIESATDDSDDTNIRKEEIKGAVEYFMGKNVNHYCYKDSNRVDDHYSSSFVKPRNILIIGNGATLDAVGDKFLIASKLAEEIKNKFTNGNKEIEQFIDRQLERLKTVFNLNTDEFETILTACAAFDEKKVRDELKKVVNYKYIPSEFYEIVGHLFKHRYIDVIINFNFDEILDNIIDEELGDSDYRKIFLDGDCPMSMDDIKVRKRLKYPIYIKPHGTISYDSSLLFTKEHYHNMAVRLKSFLESLFFAEYHTGELLDLNIIVAGFGFASVELNQILDLSLKKRYESLNEKIDQRNKVTLFVFDKLTEEQYINNFKKKNSENDNILDIFNEPEIKTSEEDDGWEHKESLTMNLSEKDKNEKNYGCKYFEINEENTLGKWFRDLWYETRRLLEAPDEKRLYRSIDRHLIISKIFWDTKNPQRFFLPSEFNYNRDYKQALKKRNKPFMINNQAYIESNRNFIKYCHDRTIVELLLLAKQSKNLLSITMIKESRAGKYYQMYRECTAEYFNNCTDSLFTEFTGHKKEHRKTLAGFLEKLGYRPYKEYTPDNYQLHYIENDNKKNLFFKDVAKSMDDDTIKLLNDIMFGDIYKEKLIKNEKEFSERLFTIDSKTAYLIKAKFNEHKLSIFKKIKDEDLLYSDIKWTYKFNDFFKEERKKSWNVLLAVSENASFAQNLNCFKKDSHEKKCLGLVLTDYCIPTMPTQESSLLSTHHVVRSKGEEISMLPWWLNNRHLRLFIKFKGWNEKEEPLYDLVGGTYYESRRMSKKVRPILITNDNYDDLDKLLVIFIDYWKRGQFHNNYHENLWNRFIEYLIKNKRGNDEDFLEEIIKKGYNDQIKKEIYKEEYTQPDNPILDKKIFKEAKKELFRNIDKYQKENF